MEGVFNNIVCPIRYTDYKNFLCLFLEKEFREVVQSSSEKALESYSLGSKHLNPAYFCVPHFSYVYNVIKNKTSSEDYCKILARQFV